MNHLKTIEDIESLCINGMGSSSVRHLKAVLQDILTSAREAILKDFANTVGIDIELEREYDQYYTRAEAANKRPLTFDNWLTLRSKEAA